MKPYIDKFLETLFWSWGSEPPAEAIWAANEFINYLNAVYYTDIIYFNEEWDAGEIGFNYNEVREDIYKKLNLQ